MPIQLSTIIPATPQLATPGAAVQPTTRTCVLYLVAIVAFTALVMNAIVLHDAHALGLSPCRDATRIVIGATVSSALALAYIMALLPILALCRYDLEHRHTRAMVQTTGVLLFIAIWVATLAATVAFLQADADVAAPRCQDHLWRMARADVIVGHAILDPLAIGALYVIAKRHLYAL